MNNLFLVKKHKHSTGIYASRFASGNADWNKRWADFKVTANIHDDFAMELYNHLQVSAIELYNHLQVIFPSFNSIVILSPVSPLFHTAETKGRRDYRSRRNFDLPDR